MTPFPVGTSLASAERESAGAIDTGHLLSLVVRRGSREGDSPPAGHNARQELRPTAICPNRTISDGERFRTDSRSPERTFEICDDWRTRRREVSRCRTPSKL